MNRFFLALTLSLNLLSFTPQETANVIHRLPASKTASWGTIDTTHRNLVLIGVEGNLDSTGGRLAHFDVPFKLSGKTAEKFQATVSYRTDDHGCSPQALMLITVDGVQAYRVITKLTQTITAVSVPVSYEFALPITKGEAVLHVETDGGCTSDFEVQGVMITKGGR